jgi:hypothetical protein
MKHRERCGMSEEAHSVLKEDLAGGQMPSNLFGANAAWWTISILAHNLNVLMKRLILGIDWMRAPHERFAIRSDQPAGAGHQPCPTPRHPVTASGKTLAMNLSAKKRSAPLAWAPAGQPFPLPRPVLNARPAGIAGHADACLRYGPRHNTIWINQTHRLSWRAGLAQASDATRNPRDIPYQAPFLWAAFAAPTGA